MSRTSPFEVEFREDENGTRFYFCQVGAEGHGRASFRLWVSDRLIEPHDAGGHVLRLPVQAQLIETAKGSLVLKPSSEHVTFDVYIPCGYRGKSKLELLTPVEQFKLYHIYRSPRGRCGISQGALVTVKTSDLPLKVRWEKTGRTYDNPREGVSLYFADGRVEDFSDLPDGLEAFNELRDTLEEGE